MLEKDKISEEIIIDPFSIKIEDDWGNIMRRARAGEIPEAPSSDEFSLPWRMQPIDEAYVEEGGRWKYKFKPVKLLFVETAGSMSSLKLSAEGVERLFLEGVVDGLDSKWEEVREETQAILSGQKPVPRGHVRYYVIDALRKRRQG